MNTEQRKAKEMEIFNSMPHNTFEEVMEVANKVNDFRDRCKSYDKMIKICDEEIEVFTRYYNEEAERYSIFEQIISSKIHQLISDFINNKNEVTLDDIRKELEKSGNPFGIIINDKQKEIKANAKGELAYGFVSDNYFHVTSTNTYYRFNNYDIAEDIADCKKTLDSRKAKIANIVERKVQIEAEGEYTLWSRDEWYDEIQWYYDGERKWNYRTDWDW